MLSNTLPTQGDCKNSILTSESQVNSLIAQEVEDSEYLKSDCCYSKYLSVVEGCPLRAFCLCVYGESGGVWIRWYPPCSSEPMPAYGGSSGGSEVRVDWLKSWISA